MTYYTLFWVAMIPVQIFVYSAFMKLIEVWNYVCWLENLMKGEEE